jgi:hemerythrin-like metal-binding protein
MPSIVLDNQLSLAIPSIDREHREMVALLNQLHDAISAGAPRSILSNALGQLIQSTKNHFAHEEYLFEQTTYPDAEAHRLVHVNTLAWLAEVRRKYDEGISGISLETVDYLKDWFFDHILGSDRQYSTFLRAAGIR